MSTQVVVGRIPTIPIERTVRVLIPVQGFRTELAYYTLLCLGRQPDTLLVREWTRPCERRVGRRAGRRCAAPLRIPAIAREEHVSLTDSREFGAHFGPQPLDRGLLRGRPFLLFGRPRTILRPGLSGHTLPAWGRGPLLLRNEGPPSRFQCGVRQVDPVLLRALPEEF